VTASTRCKERESLVTIDNAAPGRLFSRAATSDSVVMTGIRKQTTAPDRALAKKRDNRARPQKTFAPFASERTPPHVLQSSARAPIGDDLTTTWTNARASREYQPYDPARETRWARQRHRDEQERESRWTQQKQRDEDLALLYPGINTRPKFSSFTLAPNAAPRGERAPALKGQATLLDIDGAPIEFEVAAWGPHKAQRGGPDYYNLIFKPKDPALTPSRPIAHAAGVRNQPAHFALKKIGTGRMFERSAEQRTGKKLPTLYGYGLVQLPSGPGYIDLAAWVHDGSYSGRAPLHDPAAVTARAAERRPQPKPLAQPRSTNRRSLRRTTEARRPIHANGPHKASSPHPPRSLILSP